MIEKIIGAVCIEFGITYADLKSKCTIRKYSAARHIFMYLARKHTVFSLVSIGGMVNRTDHSTVLYGIRSATNQIETDPAYRATVEHINAQLEKQL